MVETTMERGGRGVRSEMLGSAHREPRPVSARGSVRPRRRCSKVCVAVLAAGASSRMGFPKLVEPFAGTSLLDRALDAALGCAADVACVITGAYHEPMAPLLAKRRAADLVLVRQGADRSWPGEGRDPLVVVRNRRWQTGQASSVQAAVRFARGCGCAAVLMLVADQPLVTASHLNALISEYNTGGSQMYVAANDRCCGNPCLIDHALFDELLALTGDEGARALLRKRRDIDARHVHFEDSHLFEDADTPEDFRRLEGMIAHG